MTPGIANRVLRWILRLMGTSSLTALLFVAAPHDLMASIHQDLGLGVMPQAPIVGYLARSTSAFYALLGGLFWVASADLPGQRRLLGYLGLAIPLLGLTLFGVDLYEGLPAFWTYWEGPFVLVFGLAILWLNRVGRAGD